MEGLIPMVFKTIRRNRTRSQYESLSSGAAQGYDIANFYPDGRHTQQYVVTPTLEKIEGFRAESIGQRRHKSLNHRGYAGRFSPEHTCKTKQLVRFRSQKLFSCVAGG